ALHDMESSIAQADQPEVLRERLQALEGLRAQMETLSRKVPAHMQGEVYDWRLHVSLVRTEALDRLQRLAGNANDKEKTDEWPLPPDKSPVPGIAPLPGSGEGAGGESSRKLI